MSAETLRRLLERTRLEIEPACREGRGEELLLGFVRGVAEDFAASTFLRAGEAVEDAGAGGFEPDEVLAWLNAFFGAGLDSLLEAVRSTYASFGAAGTPDLLRAERATVLAYSERLESLMGACGQGGSA